MLSKAVVSLILFSAALTVSGQSSVSVDPADVAAFSSIYQSLYKVDYVSHLPQVLAICGD